MAALRLGLKDLAPVICRIESSLFLGPRRGMQMARDDGEVQDIL